ncbi:MAG TPA: hypothetical protein VGA69_11855, partial [Nitriliruptorales bacterium]
GEGAGEGDCEVGVDCEGVGQEQPAAQTDVTAPQPTPADVDRSAYLGCVNGSGGPRQTEDPQSPPCRSEVFQGDNGGATWQGVTAEEIRVALPVPDIENDDQRRAQDAIALFVEHVNQHYMLFGRRFVVVEVEFAASSLGDPAAQRAVAQDVAAQDVFASLPLRKLGQYQEELAERGIVSLLGDRGIGRYPASTLDRLHPYVWAVHPSLDETHTAVGELLCQALAGRPARHGGVDVAGRARHFGLIEEFDPDGGQSYPADRLASALSACGAAHGVYRSDDVRAGEQLDVLLRRMQQDGVTTIVCSCERLTDVPLKAAEAIGFRPEWFLPGITDKDVDNSSGAQPNNEVREQMKHVFGVDANLRRPERARLTGQRLEEQFWFHAAREVDPSFEPSAAQYDDYYDYYASLLVLASGVQWAGPDLTPQTLADALVGLDYPNPGVGEAPWYQPSVGFGPADHGFNSDFALMWWRDPDDAAWEARTDFGDMCYVGGGTRFRAGAVPADVDELFFDPEAGCR